MQAPNWSQNIDPSSNTHSFIICEIKNTRSLAGPGTGKTFSLIHKIAYLLEEKKVDPAKILIITFTRAGASDIKKELLKLNMRGIDRIRACTLHSFCMGILNHHSVLDLIDRFPRPLLEYEKKPMFYDINLDREFSSQTQKRCGELLKDYESAWARFQTDEPGFIQTEEDKEFRSRLVNWLKLHNAMTIGEIIPFTLEFVRNNPMQYSYQNFDYVLVDEYQDLNKAEQSIIDSISKNALLTIVGDDNQSIYKFKNAHPEGIRDFVNTHVPCEDIPMRECRRCPKRIVRIANNLILHDSNYRDYSDQILTPHESNAEGQVDVIQWATYEDEIDGLAKIAQLILENNAGTLEPKDVLILNPSKKISTKLYEKLNELGIPSQLVTRNEDTIFDDEKSKLVHAFINFLANESDNISLRHLLQNKGDFYSDKYLLIIKAAETNFTTPIEVLERLDDGSMEIDGIKANSAIIKRFQELQAKIQDWKEINNIDEFREKVSSECGSNATRLMERINTLCDSFEEDSSYDEFVVKVAKYIIQNLLETDSFAEVFMDDESVKVMTCHSAKGLSGKLVIIGSCIDGLLPRFSEDDPSDPDPENLEEQRRLLYVAITRCKYEQDGYPGRLIISSFTRMDEGSKLSFGIKTQNRGVQASRFMMEIESELLPRSIPGSELLSSLEEKN